VAKIGRFRRDATRAVDGRWCVYREGIRIKVASSSQDEFATEVRRVSKKLREENGGQDPLAKDLLLALARPMATHLVRDWQHIEDDEGKPVPFSIGKATEYLADPEMHELRAWVFERSHEYAEYQRAAAEADEKN
jgi:hypothetical protein